MRKKTMRELKHHCRGKDPSYPLVAEYIYGLVKKQPKTRWSIARKITDIHNTKPVSQLLPRFAGMVVVPKSSDDIDAVKDKIHIITHKSAKAAISVLLTTDISLADCLDLKVSDYNRENGVLSNFRLHPWAKESVNSLYDAVIRGGSEQSGHLFCGWSNRRMLVGTKMMQKTLRKYAKILSVKSGKNVLSLIKSTRDRLRTAENQLIRIDEKPYKGEKRPVWRGKDKTFGDIVTTEAGSGVVIDVILDKYVVFMPDSSKKLFGQSEIADPSPEEEEKVSKWAEKMAVYVRRNE